MDGEGIVLGKSVVDKLDLSKIPLCAEEETAEVSAQSLHCAWHTSPCEGQPRYICEFNCGYNILRDAAGCVWIEHFKC